LGLVQDAPKKDIQKEKAEKESGRESKQQNSEALD
jgi:hypothetical protein